MQPEGIMQQNRESHTREKKHNYWKVIIVQHVRKNSATEGKIMHPKREKHATEMKKIMQQKRKIHAPGEQ